MRDIIINYSAVSKFSYASKEFKDFLDLVYRVIFK